MLDHRSASTRDIFVCLSVTYPIVHSTGRLILHDLTPMFFTFESEGGLHPKAVVWVECCSLKLIYDPTLRNTRMTPFKLVFLTVLYWISTMAVALIVTEVEYVFSIIGSSAGVVSNYMLPGLFMLDPHGAWAEGGVVKRQWWWVGQAIVCISVPVIIVSIMLIFEPAFLGY